MRAFENGSASLYYPLYLQMIEDNVLFFFEHVEPDLLIPPQKKIAKALVQQKIMAG